MTVVICTAACGAFGALGNLLAAVLRSRERRHAMTTSAEVAREAMCLSFVQQVPIDPAAVVRAVASDAHAPPPPDAVPPARGD